MDCYKGKEFMSRVVYLLDIIKMQMEDGIDLMDSLRQIQKWELILLLKCQQEVMEIHCLTLEQIMDMY